VLAVPGGGVGRDLAGGEVARERADLPLLVGQLHVTHGRARRGRRGGMRRGGGTGLRRASASEPRPPSAAAAASEPATARRRPSRSKRSTSQPSSRAIRASVASGFTATGLPTARSI